jgi:hypothetical protein
LSVPRIATLAAAAVTRVNHVLETASSPDFFSSLLIKHALERSVQAASLIGGRALIVNAIDAEAAEFWQRRGFMPSRDDSFTLFRSIDAIAASLRAGKEQG